MNLIGIVIYNPDIKNLIDKINYLIRERGTLNLSRIVLKSVYPFGIIRITLFSTFFLIHCSILLLKINLI